MQSKGLIRSFAIAAVVAIAVVPGMTAAQASRKATSFGVGGGITLPTGDYSDCCSTGWNFGGFVQWRQPNQVFGVRGEVAYDRNDFKDAVLVEQDVDNGNTNILHFGVDGVMEVAPQGSGMGWYLLAGVGMYRVETKVTVGSTTASDSKTQPGFNAGGGLTFRMGGANLFVEGRWHTVSIDYGGPNGSANYAFIPITVGVRF